MMPTRRDADPLQLDDEPRPFAGFTDEGWAYLDGVADTVVRLRTTRHRLVTAAGIAGFVGGFIVAFLLLSPRVAAAPRTAPTDSGPWTQLVVPRSPHDTTPPLANRTGPAPTGESLDPNSSSEISAAIGGRATWYCGAGSPCTRGYGPSDLVAAIDPTLGIAKGERLTVTYNGRSVRAQVVDVCACAGSRIIDLTRGAFSRLADPSVGTIPVTIEFGGPVPTLPATDSEEKP